ncbi:hypothetical protein, partial [Vibrio anguillarum]|uniref:hypothetical protein n=1 Tax=Vibrio anguillarum TaxID=55601 RepID=UPI001BE3D9E3
MIIYISGVFLKIYFIKKLLIKNNFIDIAKKTHRCIDGFKTSLVTASYPLKVKPLPQYQIQMPSIQDKHL